MLCEYCKKAELIEGMLEAVSFQPSSEHKKMFSRGVYGIKAMVCPECEQISNLSLDVEALKKVTKKRPI